MQQLRKSSAIQRLIKTKMQNMDHKDILLKAMREAGEPLNAGRIAELS